MQKIVSAFMAIIFFVSLYTYIKVLDKSGDNSSNDNRDPLVHLDDLIFFRYVGSKRIETFSAKKGRLFEPNRAEFFEDVYGSREKNLGSQEHIKADSIIAVFSAQSINQLLKNKSQLSHAVAEENVRIHLNSDILMSEKVEYSAEDAQLSSDVPVRVVGPSRRIFGDNGFIYSQLSGDLEVIGPVSGLVEPGEKNK